MYHDLILRAVPRPVPCTTIVPQYCTVLSPCAPYRTIYTKTPNGRYFHLSYLMKILVLIWAYHRTYFYFFSLILTYLFDTFNGSELIIRRIFYILKKKRLNIRKKSKKQKLYELLVMKYTSFTTTDTLLSKQKTQKMTRDRSEFELSPS